MEAPLYRGGYGDVWEGEYQGCKVAVKVLTVGAAGKLDKITRVGHLSGEFLSDEFIVTYVDVLQGSYHMESSSPSERVAPVGGDNEQKPVRDGVRMDD